MTATSVSRRALFLQRIGNQIGLEDCPATISRLFTTSSLVFDRELGRVRRQLVPLLDPEPHRLNAGFEFAVCYAATQQGLHLTTGADLSRAVLTPRPGAIASPYLDQAALDFAQQNSLGIIHTAAPVNQAILVAQITDYFPNDTVAIVVATNEEKRQWEQALVREGVDLQRHAPDRFGQQTRRVIVTLPYGTADDDCTAHARHLLIFPDAIASLGERFQCALLTLGGPRLLAFLKSDAQPSPREADLLRAQYGFAELKVPAHGCIETNVRVDFRCLTYNDLPTRPDVPSRRRLWYQPIRNRRVAQFARQLSAVASNSSGSNSSGESVATNFPSSVVVLAESVPQAIEIAKRLKRAPLYVGQDVDESRLASSDRLLLTERRPGWSQEQLIIATPAGLARMRPNESRTILWAGTGAYLPPIPQEHLATTSAAPHRIVVVDLQDCSNDLLRVSSQHRQRAYRDAGWFAPGVDAEVARIERFFETRPAGDCA